MADATGANLGQTLSAQEDARKSSSHASQLAKEANALAVPAADGEEYEDGEGLSPMRTHEQTGHEHSIADRMCHLVEQSDDEDDSKEKEVNHEKLERKELRRQKTNDKPNRLRDRLKRTVSKAG